MITITAPRAPLFAAVAVPESESEPAFAVALATEAEAVQSARHPWYVTRAAEVVALEPGDSPSPCDLLWLLAAQFPATCGDLPRHYATVAAEMLAEAPAGTAEEAAAEAAWYRDPEPATADDAAQVWIESDPELEAEACRRTLDRAGMAVVSIPAPHLRADWYPQDAAEAVVRWIPAAEAVPAAAVWWLHETSAVAP